MGQLVKHQPQPQVRLQVWKDRNQHLLRARVNEAVNRGEIEPVSHYGITAWGSATVVVRVVRERTRWRAYVAVSFLIAAMTAIGVMIYRERDVIMSAIGGCLAIVVIGYIITRVGHTARCSGLHCSGCSR